MGKGSSPAKRSSHGAGSSSGGGGGAGSTASGQNSTGGPADDSMLQLTERTAERVESTIVSRENATHVAFAASRTRDFVYAASSQYIRLLNDYCNASDSNGGTSNSSLLVVVGQPGTGKSALLAHWAALRRASSQDAGGGHDSHEFIYEHYCGCSFDSVKLSLFLFRLMNQLKLTFGLRDFELPREHEEEKLKFSFARCLEAAVGRGNQRTTGAAVPSSKQRKIVLILDGIDCIRTEDGGDSLSWLPNTFPADVRIIVSATHGSVASAASKNHGLAASSLPCARLVTRKPVVYDDDSDLIYDASLPPSDHDSHTIRELRRRRASFVVVEPLDEMSCRATLRLYSSSSPSQSPSPLSVDEQDAIVNAPGSANPLYLRLLVQGQELFDMTESNRSARCVWLERATRAGELHVVYELILKRWNEILLGDLSERMNRLMANAESATGDHEPAHKLTRRGTKRDVIGTHDSGGGGGSSTGSSAASARALARSHSIRAGSSTHPFPFVPVDPVELETLQTAMEQRALLVRHTLSLLAVSRYGLSETDLQRLLGDEVPPTICKRLLGLLAPHVMQIRRRDCGDSEVVLYDLSHNQLRLLVRYGFLRDDHLRGCYYKELATYFSGLEASQRRVDELPVQLERCTMWSALQNALVDIKMFQLWWNERNRQEFFSYWMVLRTNCSIHDPVDDFIRSFDEFIIHENPNAEQLLALCLTITDFLRAWQRIDDSRSGSLTLARPAPPQLNEFITSLGSCFSTAHLSEHDAKKVHGEIDALCIHKEDAYFVRRWLWTQFPLIGIAFESRFLRSKSLSSSSASLASLCGRESDSSSTAGSTNSSSGSAGDTSSSNGAQTSSSSKATKSSSSILPKSLVASSTAAKAALAKRKPSLLFGTKDKDTGFDMLPSSPTPGSPAVDEGGAFEFLSAENTDLTVGSVSKFESQLVELRMKYDKLKFIAKERQAALKTLDSRLLDARAQVRAAGQSAGQIEELLDQMRQINDETIVGRQRSDYYKAILRHCEIHPARDPNAIEVTESAVNKMKQDVIDLQQKTQVVSYETRLALMESKKLQQVIDDKSEIHATALARLRWRCELMQRMAVVPPNSSGEESGQVFPIANATAAVAAAAAAAAAEQQTKKKKKKQDNDDSGDDVDDDDDDDENDVSDEDQETMGVVLANGMPKQASSLLDTQLGRAKDKLLHKKETTLERLRKVESLKVYVGSPFKDDGVLGALRQVGINKPEEAHLYWQDQQQHAAQLAAEEKSLDKRVGEYRDKLASVQAQLLNLKLGGSSGSSNNTSHSHTSGDGACTNSTMMASSASGGAASSSGGASMSPASPTASGGSEPTASTGSNGSGGTGGASSATHNLKFLEQQLAEAAVVTQQKKERAARLKSLSERLHLGLHHVSQILGVGSAHQMDSIELGDAVEQVVRLYLGDEGHMPSTASTNLRRKNSVRAMGIANQSGLHAFVPPDTRTADEKVRFNVRVSKSPQRQMNPYVDGDAVATSGGDDDDDDDDDEEDEEDDEKDGEDPASSGSTTGTTATGNQERATTSSGSYNTQHDAGGVTRRADIKNRSRMEVERKLRTPAAKQPREKTPKTAAKASKRGEKS